MTQTMTPATNNEIRDLQPVVQALALRAAFVLAALLLAASLIAFIGAIRVATVEEQVWAVTSSGRPFQITAVPEKLAQRVLQTPGAQQAVADAKATR